MCRELKFTYAVGLSIMVSTLDLTSCGRLSLSLSLLDSHIMYYVRYWYGGRGERKEGSPSCTIERGNNMVILCK
jgi:hypothetical protein